MNKQVIIEINNLSYQTEGKEILKGISLEVLASDAIAIVGRSGSGKTLLAKIIAGHFSPTSGELKFNLPSNYKRLFISQQHDFRDFVSRAYYQQRFEPNYGIESPKVSDILQKISSSAEAIDKVCSLLKIQDKLSTRLLELSNGEGKRVQLAKALLQQPEILIFDNPFLGLDKEARSILHRIIDQLIEEGIIIILVTSPDEIPQRITKVLELDRGTVKNICSLADYKFDEEIADSKLEVDEQIVRDIINTSKEDFALAVSMNNVTVRYGDNIILDNICWTVKKGEKWGLVGPNGAGKSTLLSLINADNPQAYSNDIVLFDRKRGSGESIWDIKNKIGYISPELHLFFQRNPSYAESLSITSGSNELRGYSQPSVTCYEAIASGFNNQVGSSQSITSLQARQVDLWMKLLQIAHLRYQPLYKLGLGEQRIVLLARALVKNPAMLILDEPCQGLDKEQTRRFVDVTDKIVTYFDKTLIFVSHYQTDFPESVKNFLVLEKGRVKEIIYDNERRIE
ncbi:MAG TPA: ATP-binding cassette domain-containing protein [Cytophagaceae bacterium]